MISRVARPADGRRDVAGAAVRVCPRGWLCCALDVVRSQKSRVPQHHLVTLCMTLFIQRSEHRNMQAEPDELLRVRGEARNDLRELDNQEPEQVERSGSSAGEE